jgi:hypothetical protein
LENININLGKYDFLEKFEKYGIVFKHRTITIPKITKNECMKSNKILIYTGYCDKKWNHSYSLKYSLGGSERAVLNIAYYLS